MNEYNVKSENWRRHVLKLVPFEWVYIDLFSHLRKVSILFGQSATKLALNIEIAINT